MKINRCFNWIREKFKKMLDEMHERERKETLAKYSEFVYDCYRNKNNTLIGNFSYEGYRNIFENMISGASFSIYIFCEDYDKIFTDELFPMFLFKAQSGIRVRIITYGNKEPRFEQLNNSHADYKYYSVHTEHPERLNNFIVVDEKSYWMDDKSWFIRKDFSRLKACANFCDFRRCVELLNICNKAIEIAK